MQNRRAPKLSRRDHADDLEQHLIGDEAPSLFELADPHPAQPLPWPNYDHVDPIGSWRDRAACPGLVPGPALCAGCDARWWCLDYALRADAAAIRGGAATYRGEWGTWGGLTRPQRQRLLETHGLDPNEALIAVYRDAHPR